MARFSGKRATRQRNRTEPRERTRARRPAGTSGFRTTSGQRPARVVPGGGVSASRVRSLCPAHRDAGGCERFAAQILAGGESRDALVSRLEEGIWRSARTRFRESQTGRAAPSAEHADRPPASDAPIVDIFTYHSYVWIHEDASHDGSSGRWAVARREDRRRREANDPHEPDRGRAALRPRQAERAPGYQVRAPDVPGERAPTGCRSR